MTRYLRFIAIIIASCGLLAFFLSGLDLVAVWREVRGGHSGLLFLTLVTTASLYVVRTWRWQMLLRPIGRARFGNALRATIIGFGLSAMLPARPGEVVRPYVLARREGFNTAATFSTIVVERLLDLVTVLLLFGGFLTLSDPGLERADPRVFEAVKIGAAVSAVGALVAVWLVFLIAGRPEVLDRILRPLVRILPRRAAELVNGLAEKVSSGFAVVRQPVVLAGALVLSVVHWVMVAFCVWTAVSAYRLAVPFTGSFLLLGLLVVGVSVPTPGAVGGFHAALQIGLTAFYAAQPDKAAAAAIVLHAISFVPVALVSLVLFIPEGMTIAVMRRAASKDVLPEAPAILNGGRHDGGTS